MPFDRIAINVVDQHQGTYIVKYHAGLEIPGGERTVVHSLDGSLSEHLMQTQETLIRPNLPDDMQFGETDQRCVDVGIRSAIAVPLISNGRVMSTLSLLSLSLDSYGAREQRILERLASQIAPAIENAELYDGISTAERLERERIDELETLFQVASILNEPRDFIEKATRVLESVAQVVGADAATLRVPNSGDTGLSLIASTSPEYTAGDSPYKGSFAGEAFTGGQTWVVDDYPSHPLALTAGVKLGVKALVVLPIKIGGVSIAVVIVRSNEPGYFVPSRVALLEAIANGLGTLLENSKLAEELRLRVEETAAVHPSKES